MERRGGDAERRDDGRAALARALERVGDRWSLLVVAALLEGGRRFNELLDALEGIAPNVLSQRLKHLEREGIVLARPYSHRPPRFSYELSAAGQELGGALRLLAAWGARRGGGSPVHGACGTPLEARWYCPTCGQVAEPGEPADLHYA